MAKKPIEVIKWNTKEIPGEAKPTIIFTLSVNGLNTTVTKQRFSD